MWDVLLDTFLDTLKTIPFLYLAYLLMEYLEHRMNAGAEKAFHKAGPFAPLIGSALGLIPQCGFSAAAGSLYAGRVISLGTLFAVFLSTSDEMLLIFLSHSLDGSFALWSALRILLGKFLCGALFGMGIDLVLKLFKKDSTQTESQEHAHVEECYHHGHDHGVFVSALFHMLQIAGFLFLFSFILNTVFYFLGDSAFAFLENHGFLSYILSALVGLIPNCAASVAITECYLKGAISLGALYAGVLPGAGVGLLVLFRTNKPVKQNIFLILGLFAIGVLCGFLIDALDLSFLGLQFLN